MPNRILRDGILESELIDALSVEAELFYRRLMSVVDDFGRFEADPVILRSRCYPRRVERVSVEQITQWMQECARPGPDGSLLTLYTVERKNYLWFHKLGEPRAKKSKYPPPPSGVQAYARTCEQTRAYVPYAYANADASSYSDASERAATPARPPARHEPSQDQAKGATASAGQPASERGERIPDALIERIWLAMQEKFPRVDRGMAERVADAAVREIRAHGLSPADLEEHAETIIHNASRRHMKNPGLYLTTVPEEIRHSVKEVA